MSLNKIIDKIIVLNMCYLQVLLYQVKCLIISIQDKLYFQQQFCAYLAKHTAFFQVQY